MSQADVGTVHRPLQDRSRATMTLILDAAAQILESKTFEELTIAEVVQQAGTSVGAFYGRFKDKDALLLALDERFYQEFEREFNVILLQPGWLKQPIPVIIRSVVDFMVTQFSKNRGVLRSLNLMARMQSSGPFKDREKRIWGNLFPLFQDFLLYHKEEIMHPNPNLAAELGVQQLIFTLHEIFLWGALREGRQYETNELCDEMTRAFMAYLEVKQSTGPEAPCSE